ncbi:hypothetical protein FACS189499_01550 [Clostridia bacterium]|nr:hypothetical protein FACS189499_01550 [Clostridia bacterium]
MGKPASAAVIRGNNEYRNIYGIVNFWKYGNGTLVSAEINGLPKNQTLNFYLSSNGSCRQTMGNSPHRERIRELPALHTNAGTTATTFFTDRFTPAEIKDWTVRIDGEPERGGYGNRKPLACGEIK